MPNTNQNPPTDAQATGGSGVPANLNNGQSDADMGAHAHDAGTIPPDFDFDIQRDPEPRPAGNPQADNTGVEPAPGGQSPISRLSVNFKGETREYDETASRNMIQQYLNMSEMSPVVGRARALAAATGVTDPAQLAQLIEDAVMGHMSGQQGGGQQPQPSAPTAPAATQPGQQGMPVPGLDGLQPSMSAEEAAAQVDEFYSTNGMVPTDAVRAADIAKLMYGSAIAQVVQILPQLANDVNQFKQQKDLEIRAARAEHVGATAERVANELGIDTPEEAQAFQSWIETQSQFIPNFKQIIGANPDAMENAIRTFAGVHMGQKAVQERDTLRSNVQQDLSRAGGETVASRGSAGITGQPQPKDFNKTMMDML